MKKTLYSLIALCWIINLSGCADIDIVPQTQPTKETWFQNELQAQMTVDELYSYKKWPMEATRPFLFDEWSDDWFQNGAISDPGPTGNITSDNSFVQTQWKTTYNSITNANLAINSIAKLRAAGDSDKLKTLQGEALFMRATFYSYIIFFWGDAPYYTHDITISEAQNMSRTPKADILKNIYDDYDQAFELLPESNPGRVSKNTVAPFKARVALWMQDWRTAASEAWKCMESKAYTLDSSFENVTKPSSTSKEWIFTLARSRSLDDASKFSTLNYISRIIKGYTGNRGPSWELLCSFLCTDGKPIDKSPLYDPHNPFKNRDPRCAYTIIEFGSKFLGYEFSPEKEKVKDPSNKDVKNTSSPLMDNGATENALYLRKGIDETWIDDTYGENNAPVLRLADVMLVYAEAKIELGEIDDTVLKAMNDIRERAYKNSSVSAPAITTKDKDELRSTLRFERRMELAFENKRYFDLIRWRVAEKCLNRPHYKCLQGLDVNTSDLAKLIKEGDFFFTSKALPKVDADGLVDLEPVLNTGTIRVSTARSFPKRQYLFPIPVFDMVTCPKFVQNEGY